MSFERCGRGVPGIGERSVAVSLRGQQYRCCSGEVNIPPTSHSRKEALLQKRVVAKIEGPDSLREESGPAVSSTCVRRSESPSARRAQRT